jgi:beta-N-acetylhexosaminidase
VDAPVDRRTQKPELADDALPYPWLGSVLTTVMPAHVLYPRVDKLRPAGFSRTWLQDILRGRLGFDGAIFSDDLSMEGARRVADVDDGRLLSYSEAAVLALQAGCDLVLLCNQSVGSGEAIDELLEGLDAATAHGLWEPDPVCEQRRKRLLPTAPALDWNALMRDPSYLAALERLP